VGYGTGEVNVTIDFLFLFSFNNCLCSKRCVFGGFLVCVPFLVSPFFLLLSHVQQKIAEGYVIWSFPLFCYFFCICIYRYQVGLDGRKVW